METGESRTVTDIKEPLALLLESSARGLEPLPRPFFWPNPRLDEAEATYPEGGMFSLLNSSVNVKQFVLTEYIVGRTRVDKGLACNGFR